ncbi:MAG: hypothetical protein E7019_05725 [Alphaproteobacteria bacterium]|nr:hypothetical protein [Alphaproteobacteria bacterium]
MSIESFFAPNINQAMLQIRATLGEDAVILNQQKIHGGIVVTASCNENKPQNENNISMFDLLSLQRALEYHCVDEISKQQIIAECKKNIDDGVGGDQVLESALNNIFDFCSILHSDNRVQMFMGTPGVGKSTVIAKLATKAKMDNISVAVVSTDNVRAGANQQLKTMADILDVDFYFYKDPQELFDFLQKISIQYDKVLIDTPGINPFVETELRRVSEFADVFKGDKILTADACRNVSEALEIAEIFKSMGANLLLPTRLDLTRRIGGVLSVGCQLKLGLCAVGIGASVTKGLASIDAKKLSKLILQ